MKWSKLGLIFTPNTDNTWSKTHAQVPTVDVLSDEIWRIFYSSRDSSNQSRISYFDVEAGNPSNVIYRHDKPIMDLGKLGAFDDAGMMPSSIVTLGHYKYLYYTGWSVRKSVPYHNSIGLAISSDGGQTFCRAGDGPLLGPILNEPYFVGTATITYDAGVWRNWYAACTGWEIINGSPEPRYNLRYAESTDGIHWQRNGKIAIDYRDEAEGGLVRAAVLHDSESFRMWFSRRDVMGYRHDRKHSYRISYAESPDGRNWTRLDDFAGIDVSDSGWDAEMTAYPSMAVTEDEEFLFYDGNSFGRSGIGVAERIKSGI